MVGSVTASVMLVKLIFGMTPTVMDRVTIAPVAGKYSAAKQKTGRTLSMLVNMLSVARTVLMAMRQLLKFTPQGKLPPYQMFFVAISFSAVVGL